MIAVNDETLPQLLDRRLHEMGAHRGEPLTLNEAYHHIPPGQALVTYEVIRRVRADGHTRIGDKAVRTIATMLRVDEDVVRRAAGQRPKQGPFELPARADKLNEKERAAVVAVVDAILEAAESSQRQQPAVVAARQSAPAATRAERHAAQITDPERRAAVEAEMAKMAKRRVKGQPNG